MTNEEFKSQFDIFWNNITSNQAPGLDTFEISVLLTKAQAVVVKNYFTPKANILGEGIGESPKRQVDFSSIIKNAILDTVEVSSKFDNRSQTFVYPADAFLIINEQVSYEDTGITKFYTVQPIAYPVYDKLMERPYKRPHTNTVWKLITGAVPNEEEVEGVIVTHNNSLPVVEVIGPKELDNKELVYKIRYVRQLKPILLEDFDESIDGETQESPCELPEELHDEILFKAVEMAKLAWMGADTQTQPQQQRSRE